LRKISVCHLCVYGSFSDIYQSNSLSTQFDGCTLKSREPAYLRYDCSDFEQDRDLKSGD
jgi:hypothetical protein